MKRKKRITNVDPDPKKGIGKHKRVTNVEPWPKGALTKAYKITDAEGWDKVEEAAMKAQGQPPHWDD